MATERIRIGTAVLEFEVDDSGLVSGLKKVEGNFGGVSASLGQSLKAMGSQATAVGTALSAAVSVPLVALGTGVSKLAIDFESAFAGVRKTVDATEPEFQALATGFRNLSKEMPISVTELLKVGEAAGQLGIKKENILSFTETMAKLGATTNLSADEAATAMARFTNIMGTPQQAIDQLGASLVALGNDGASTEAEIVDMALRIAGAGKTIGLTEGDVLGLANALSSVGIEAEMGGSAISKVMIEIASAVEHGGESLKGFADVAGMSGQKFRDLFERDAGAAMTAFLSGLGKVESQGGSLLTTLENLGVTEVRMRDTMLRVANAGDLVAESMKLGNVAFEEGNALNAEFAKRAETTEAKLKVLWNRIKDVGITIGESLKPALDSAIQMSGRFLPIVESMAKWFGELPGSVQLAGFALGGLAIAIGPLVLVFGQVLSAAGSIAVAFGAGGVLAPALTTITGLFNGLFAGLGTGTGILGTAFQALNVFTGPVGWLIGAAAGLLTVTDTWGEFGRIVSAVAETIKNIAIGAFEGLIAVIKNLFEIGQGLAGFIADVGRFVLELTGIGDMWRAFVEDFKVAMDVFATIAEGVAFWTGSFIEDLPKVKSPLKDLVGEGLKPAGDAARYLAMSTDELNKMLAPNVVKTRQAADNTAELKKQQAAAKKEADEFAKAIDQANDAVRQLGLVTERDVNEAIGQLHLAINGAVSGGISLRNILPSVLVKLDELTKKAKDSGLNTAYLTQMSRELRAELSRLSPAPVLPAELFLSGEEGLAALTRGVQGVTAEQLRARTDAFLLRDAYETLGITSREELLSMARTARQAYDDMVRSGKASSTDLIAARERVLEAERAAGLETVSIWRDKIKPAVEDFIKGSSQAISTGLVDMIGHWNRHAELLRGIWQGIKNTFLNVLDEMLSSFLNNFLKGLLNGIGAAKLGQNLAGSLLGMIGLGGGGATSSLIGAGAGPLITSLTAPPAAAGVGAGAGAVGGGIGAGAVATFVGGALAPIIIGHLINQGPMYTPYLSPDQVQSAYQEYFGDGYQQFLPEDLMRVTPGDVPWWNGTPAGSGAEPESFAVGTPRFDFKRFDRAGSPSLLHGDEAIVPRGGGHELASEIATALGPVLSGASESGLVLVMDHEVVGRIVGRTKATQEELGRGIELNTHGLGTSVRRAQV